MLPIEVSSATITEAGFRYDRQFVLIEEPKDVEEGTAKFLTIKTTSRLCLFHQRANEDFTELEVTYSKAGKSASIKIPFMPSPNDLADSITYTVDLFGTKAVGTDMGESYKSFFSKVLEQQVRLLYIGETGMRDLPLPASLIPQTQTWVSRLLGHAEDKIAQKTRFADAAPLLLTTTGSEDEACSRLPKAFQSKDVIKVFRPNIHIETPSDFKPYSEDNWEDVSILPKYSPDSSPTTSPSIDLTCIFRCPRCQSLNADMETGGLVPNERSLYKLLVKDRRVNEMMPTKPCFGVYAIAKPIGAVVSIGDVVEVKQVM